MHRPASRHALPEFTDRSPLGTRTLDPYAKLFGERIVVLGAPLDDTAANDAVARLLLLEHASPGQDIQLYINSPGGPFAAMTAVYDTLAAITCDVATTCIGRADSTAALLLASGTPGKRSALPGSRILLRQPAADEPLHGSPSDLAVHAEELLRRRALTVALTSRHTGRDEAAVAGDLERDLVLDARAAKAYGVVDHVLGGRRGTGWAA
ncbi:ATP-dependent Clp protease proteolytic subunit [Streptomyces sp. C10-9-1]|uniref:ATP-dependent Clp protease proteolytic subunit n=1 Tax=Streptomyces sp. C10-9-1 TaxID=1859285 RepID=UPI003D75E5D9